MKYSILALVSVLSISGSAMAKKIACAGVEGKLEATIVDEMNLADLKMEVDSHYSDSDTPDSRILIVRAKSVPLVTRESRSMNGIITRGVYLCHDGGRLCNTIGKNQNLAYVEYESGSGNKKLPYSFIIGLDVGPKWVDFLKQGPEVPMYYRFGMLVSVQALGPNSTGGGLPYSLMYCKINN